MNKIIDTHVHLFDLNKFNYPWLDSYPQINKNFLLKDYIEETSIFSLDYFVIVEADVDKAQKNLETEYFSNLAENSHNIKFIASADLLSNDFDEYLELLSKNPHVKGVRHLLHLDNQDPRLCLEPIFIKNLKKLEKYNFIFEACIKMNNFDFFYELALQVPNVTLILNHMGNVDPYLYDYEKKCLNSEIWLSNMKKLGKLKNVICKISGLNIDLSKVQNEEICSYLVKTCIENFSIEKIIIGSNYPVYLTNINVQSWFTLILKILKNYPKEISENILYSNPYTIYFK